MDHCYLNACENVYTISVKFKLLDRENIIIEKEHTHKSCLSMLAGHVAFNSSCCFPLIHWAVYMEYNACTSV